MVQVSFLPLIIWTISRPQGLLLVQTGGRRNPWPRLPKWLQKFLRILSRKHDKVSLFGLNNSFRLQKTKTKQTRPPDAGGNLRKSHFIMCHVTKYSTILGVWLCVDFSLCFDLDCFVVLAQPARLVMMLLLKCSYNPGH